MIFTMGVHVLFIQAPSGMELILNELVQPQTQDRTPGIIDGGWGMIKGRIKALCQSEGNRFNGGYGGYGGNGGYGVNWAMLVGQVSNRNFLSYY